MCNRTTHITYVSQFWLDLGGGANQHAASSSTLAVGPRRRRAPAGDVTTQPPAGPVLRRLAGARPSVVAWQRDAGARHAHVTWHVHRLRQDGAASQVAECQLRTTPGDSANSRLLSSAFCHYRCGLYMNCPGNIFYLNRVVPTWLRISGNSPTPECSGSRHSWSNKGMSRVTVCDVSCGLKDFWPTMVCRKEVYIGLRWPLPRRRAWSIGLVSVRLIEGKTCDKNCNWKKATEKWQPEN